jgi:hypothetical protein
VVCQPFDKLPRGCVCVLDFHHLPLRCRARGPDGNRGVKGAADRSLAELFGIARSLHQFAPTKLCGSPLSVVGSTTR